MSTAALSLQAHAQPARALLERLFSTFEDVAYGLADRRDFEPTGRVSDVRELPALVRTTFGDNNLISVGVNHQVGVMRDHDHLALALRSNEEADQLIKNGLGIKIFLGLIDNQRPVIGIIECKIEQQQNDAARAWRKLADFDPVIIDAVADLDVVG